MLNSHLVIITGAGRGFGRAIALAFANALLSKVHLVLIGRSASDLQTTANLVAAIRPQTVTSEVVIADLEDAASLPVLSAQVFFSADRYKNYTNVVFFSNAGTIHPIAPIDSALDHEALARAMQLNVLSPIVLTSDCIRSLNSEQGCISPAETSIPLQAVLVNISSRWATEPVASLGVYGATKAAMKSYYEVLAKESKSTCSSCNSSSLSVKVLNYTPGSLDTSMQREIRDCSLTDPDWKLLSCQMQAEGKLVNPDESALKCALVVIQDLFQSGDHLDYSDPVEGIDYPRKSATTCCANPNCQCGVNCKCSKDNGPQCGGCHSFLLENRK